MKINARIVKWGIRPGACFLASADEHYLDIEGNVLESSFEDRTEADLKSLFENSTLASVEVYRDTIPRSPVVRTGRSLSVEIAPVVAYRLTFKRDGARSRNEVEFVYADSDKIPAKPWVRA